jgi:hypothetical protein
LSDLHKTTAPNAAVRIKEGDLVEKEEPSFTWKKETCPCARYARGLGGDQVSGSRATVVPMSYQRTAGLSDQQLFDQFDREFAAIEEENGGGCTSQEIVDWARRHPRSLLYELFDWKKGVMDEYRVMQWETFAGRGPAWH